MADPNINLVELTSKLPLRSYQQLAIERVIDDFYKGHRKLLVEMEVGTGRTSVITSIIYILLQTNSVSRVLFLASRRIQVEQTRNYFLIDFPEAGAFVAQDLMSTGVYFTTIDFKRYADFQPYDIIIIDDAQEIKRDFKIIQFFDLGKCVVGFANHNRIDGDIGWFDDSKKSFKYTVFQSLDEGYRSFEREPKVLYSIIKKIFADIGYTFVDINPSIFYAENNEVRPDFMAPEIIRFLFATEFIKESKQHRTEDDLFRMDMLCALKGTAEFWKFLIQFYKTKFVVFEFKNYAEPIPQNLIYTTEKYLFKPALRNVAIIISREGFDDHANDVALGCLKETGKLIIDITDEDLISMLLSKIDGKEPSDVLLDKTLNMLMSIGK